MRSNEGDAPRFGVSAIPVASKSGMSPLTAGLLHVRVTELLEFLDQPVAVIALDLDDAVLDGAAGAALLLERAADLFELRAR